MGCRDVYLHSIIMEIDGTLLVVLKVPQNLKNISIMSPSRSHNLVIQGKPESFL